MAAEAVAAANPREEIFIFQDCPRFVFLVGAGGVDAAGGAGGHALIRCKKKAENREIKKKKKNYNPQKDFISKKAANSFATQNFHSSIFLGFPLFYLKV